VDAARLARWCQGFAERHGGPPVVTRQGARVVLTAPDGATAALLPGFPLPAGVPPDVAADATGTGPGRPDPAGDAAAAVAGWAAAPRRCAVVLVRRGGYACAVVDGRRVVVSKVGTRYVQGRTAAGGWSQQRFARRRDNQAKALVEAVVGVAARLLVDASAQWLVTGGDRPLVEDVLRDRRLAPVAALPRGPHLALGDPRADVLRALADLMARVRIDLTP